MLIAPLRFSTGTTKNAIKPDAGKTKDEEVFEAAIKL